MMITIPMQFSNLLLNYLLAKFGGIKSHFIQYYGQTGE